MKLRKLVSCVDVTDTASSFLNLRPTLIVTSVNVTFFFLDHHHTPPMASPTSTFTTLRALQLVIADALNDIQRVFSQNSLSEPPSSPPSQCSSPIYQVPDPSPATTPFPATPPASFPSTPLSATFPSTPRSPPQADTSIPLVDYPSPDLPLVSNSLSEQLASLPDVAAAASRIVAACGQMSSIVHNPFSSICEAVMSVCNSTSILSLLSH